MDVAGRQRERDDLAFMIEHQMQLQAEEPASAGLAAPGQAGKHLVAVDSTRGTHPPRGGLALIKAAPSSPPPEPTEPEWQPHMGGPREEAGLCRPLRESTGEARQHHTLVE